MDIQAICDDIGCAEGPTQLPGGDIAVVSIDRGYVYRISRSGSRSALAFLGGGPNSTALGVDGSLYVAQSGGRRNLTPSRRRVMTGGVQVIRTNGSVDWVTQDPISPNDLCFGPDGGLYVTDPTDELRDGRIWRVDVASGDCELIAAVDWYTNGIAFTPDDDALLVSSTWDGRVMRFPFGAEGLGKAEAVLTIPDGHPDGLAFDKEGHFSLGVFRRPEQTEIQTWSLDGRFIDSMPTGETSHVTNLLITAECEVIATQYGSGSGVIVISPWPRPGLSLHPFRARSADEP